jgi:chaperonin GroES
MKVVPLGDRIVVKRLEGESRTVGGIVLPDSAREKPQEGRVLSIGDGRLLAGGQRAKSQIQEGDRIIFAAWSGMEIKVNGDELLILREDDVLAVRE